MPKHLQKSLQDYLSKIKKQTQQNIQHPPSKKWILSGCKHPKTKSFDQTNDAAATLSDVDRFLCENFKSLYLKEEDGHGNNNSNNNVNNNNNNNNKKKKGLFVDHEANFRVSSKREFFGSPRFDEPPPDLCGSHRFIVSSASSSSLIEEARNSSTATTYEDVGSTSTSATTLNNDHSSSNISDDNSIRLPKDCIAVLKYSPSPCDDFRRSMQEMVEARVQHNAKVDWEFMEELLFCYLNLNDKRSHKFILSAFVDSVVVLRQNPNKIPARSPNFRLARQRRRRRMRNVT